MLHADHGDWSSDVCSSDLQIQTLGFGTDTVTAHNPHCWHCES
jgi:hypothetical protein